MKFIGILIFCFILFSTQDFAQVNNSYKIMGAVEDSVSGLNLSNVNVTIISRKDGKIIGGSTTNEKGYFDINKIPESNVRAKFSMVGYQTKIIDSISLKNTSHIGIVRLNATTILLPEVVIKTIKPMVELKVDKEVINIDQVPGKSGSLTDVLRNTGLVNVDPVLNSISVRGQGVKLEMDGHPYDLPDNTLVQLPADMFEQVEVILSPGARESAEGGTYILNIISKKSVLDNFNGSVNLGAATNDRFNGGLNLNYKENKMNIFFSFVEYYNDNLIMNSTSQIINYNSPGFHYLNSYSSSDGSFLTESMNLGLDYQLDTNDFITFTGSQYRSKNSGVANSSNLVENYLNIAQYNYTSLRYYDTPWDKYSLNFFYKKTFSRLSPQSSERKLTFDAYFSNIYNPFTNNLSTAYSYQADLPLLHNSKSVENANTFIFRVDYVVPMEIGEFEMGYNFTYRHRQNENTALDFSYLTNTWFDSLALSNIFRYKENIHAAYISYSNEIDRFAVKTGLRMEDLTSEGDQVTTSQNFNHNYLNFFPNLNLSYNISQLFQITFNAFRRVKYPEIYYLNPFVTYNSHNNFMAGNPDIRPYYINSYALGLSQYINLYYNTMTGIYKYVTAKMQDSISYTCPVNLNSNKVYGVDLSLPYYNSPAALFHLPDFISMLNLGFTYRYSKTTGSYLNEDLYDWGYSKSVNVIMGLRLWYDINANINIIYTPRTESLKYINNQAVYTVVSFDKSFLKEKLNTSLTAFIPYNNYDSQTYGTEYYLHSNSKQQNSWGINLNISYKFNNYNDRYDRDIDDGRDVSGK